MSAFHGQDVVVKIDGQIVNCVSIDVINGRISAVYYRDDSGKKQWTRGRDAKVTISKHKDAT